jgi:hypothetical protein
MFLRVVIINTQQQAEATYLHCHLQADADGTPDSASQNHYDASYFAASIDE